LGSWALAFAKLPTNQTHWLHEQGDEQQSLMINLRISSLPNATTMDQFGHGAPRALACAMDFSLACALDLSLACALDLL